MIGKPEWFTYRIFGWGIRPRTKEGWAYILVAVALILGISYLPMNSIYKTIAITLITGVIVLDTLHIMTQLGKVHDEREKKHQLIIERNVSFVAVVAVVAVLIYKDLVLGIMDYGLFVVLGAMVAAKIISSAWFWKKG